MSGLIYRLLIGAGQTTLGYKEALKRCQPGWKILDVGTGDGFALLRNRDAILEKNLSIVCLEPDAQAARLLELEIAKVGLENQIKVRVEYLSHAREGEYNCCLCITTLVVFQSKLRQHAMRSRANCEYLLNLLPVLCSMISY
mmetsp:Transcript_7967/g.35350  ORF Transcript_7967/g.35350 Transcript_7967/m.35350 type:complete len:142 (-) Transcript_7967:1406-1831(-)